MFSSTASKSSTTTTTTPSHQQQQKHGSVSVDFNPNESLLHDKHVKLEGVKQEDIQRYHDIIDMLLAAGYYRVRISALTPFDKVIGGLCWSISNSNVDVDVDITFEEESNIGQKIAVSEQIVNALARMRCPHKIQAYQIQGLDFQEIHKVMQWLIKTVFETREENRERIKKYSHLVFSRRYELPSDVQARKKYLEALPYMDTVKGIYRPKRKYRLNTKSKLNRWAHVQSVLLEYGREYGSVKQQQQQQQQDGSNKKHDDLRAELERQMGAEGGKSSGSESQWDQMDDDVHRKRIEELKRAMTNENATENDIVSTRGLNMLIGLGSGDIEEEILKNEQRNRELLEKQQEYGQSEEMIHKRNKAQLEKQIVNLKEQFQAQKTEHSTLNTKLTSMQEELQGYKQYSAAVEQKLSEIQTKLSEGGEDFEALAKLQELVLLNESLRKQEEDFRANCKKQHAELKGILAKLQAETDSSIDHKLVQTMAADEEKMAKIKQLSSQKNLEIAILQRKIDEIPTRAELSQYERRFTELFSTIIAKLEENRKYFDTHNTLSEMAKYLEKEMSLLNSIHENFQKALTSKNKQYRTWMVETVEKSVAAVEKTREHVEKKTNEKKNEHSIINKQYTQLVSEQRAFFRNLKELQEEIKKNEELQKQLQQRQL